MKVESLKSRINALFYSETIYENNYWKIFTTAIFFIFRIFISSIYNLRFHWYLTFFRKLMNKQFFFSFFIKRYVMFYWPATDFVTNVILISSDIRKSLISDFDIRHLISDDITWYQLIPEKCPFLISEWRLWQNPWQTNNNSLDNQDLALRNV